MTQSEITHQVDYWNNAAKNKDFTHPFDFEKFDSILPKNARLLDYGCGYGRILNELHANQYQNLIGLDFSEKQIARGSCLFPYLTLNVIQHAEIPYADNYFDAVILFAVLTCIPDITHQENLVKEIKRVLKPNGIIYISDYLLQSKKNQTDRYKQYKKKYSTYGIFELADGAILRHHDLNYLKKLLSPFSKIWDQKIEVMTMNGNRSMGFQYMGKYLG